MLNFLIKHGRLTNQSARRVQSIIKINFNKLLNSCSN